MSPSAAAGFEHFRELCGQKRLEERRRIQQGKPVWVFGAGQFGRDVCGALRAEGHDVQGFIESRARAESVMGLPVRTWADLEPTQLRGQLALGIFNRGMPLNELAGIARSAGFTDIFMPWDLYRELGHRLGWRFWLSPPETILDNLSAIESTHLGLADEVSRACLLDICSFRLGLNESYGDFSHPERQYFNDLTLNHFGGTPMTFVDGGAYNGDTFLEILKTGKVNRAYLFEPDPENFKALTLAVKSEGAEAHCLPLAVADWYRVLSFNAGNGEGGNISEGGSVQIAAVFLDEILPSHSVHFIKLDVEGGEIQALIGAESLIKRSRPILAISLYHKPEDIWEIYNQLTLLCVDYNYYIRQHHFNSFDSVIYAIPN